MRLSGDQPGSGRYDRLLGLEDIIFAGRAEKLVQSRLGRFERCGCRGDRFCRLGELFFVRHAAEIVESRLRRDQSRHGGLV